VSEAIDLLEEAKTLIGEAETIISQPPPPPPPPTSSQRSIRRTWLGIFNTDLFDYTRAARFDTFVAHYFDSWANQGAKYRSANPDGDCLVYCNVGTAGGASAITLETARQYGWLAKHNGAEIPNPWGGSAFVVDVGKPGVVDAYIGAIVAKWGSSRWTGIFADDANCWANLWRNGTPIDGYVSYGDWWIHAMLPLLEALAQRGGWLVIPNLGDWLNQPIEDAAALACAGGMEEHFLTWENGATVGAAGIERQYQALRKCLDAGKQYHGIVHRIDQQGLLYAWGMAAIMGGDKPELVRVGNQTAYGSIAATYRPELDIALGAPTGPVGHATGSSSWARIFSGGYKLTCDTTAQTCVLS